MYYHLIKQENNSLKHILLCYSFNFINGVPVVIYRKEIPFVEYSRMVKNIRVQVIIVVLTYCHTEEDRCHKS